MAPKIFITGITGYIGGDILYALTQSHPDYHISALIRTQEQATHIAKTYPNLRPVIGTLDSPSLLSTEAAAADITIHTADASDHEPAARALASGLATHPPSRPGFWLHTSGTGILTYFDTRDGLLGAPSPRHFDDWARVHELTSLPAAAFHRNVDALVLAAGAAHPAAVKTAVVCPPTIYGRGRGPGNVRSRQAYELARVVLREGYVPVVGAGQARWNAVHVADLSDLFVLLVEAAVGGRGDDEELWGARGYFLAENGEFEWGALARRMAAAAAEMGFIERGYGERTLGREEALEVADFQALSWGLNSRGTAERARRVLGWRPERGSIEEEIPNILREERERLER